MKKLLALFTAVTIFLAAGITAAAGELVLVSKGAAVTSSGCTFNLPATNITDGNTSSIWSSNDSSNIWAIVDLGQEYNIERIDIYPRMDMDQSISRGNFAVQISNESDFSEYITVLTVGAQAHKEVARVSPGLDEGYRYVRIIKTSGTYLCIGEVMVFNDPAKKIDNIKIIEADDMEGKILNRLNLLSALDCINFEIEENKFRPEAEVTRAELVSMLMRAARTEIPASTADVFDDIAESFAKEEINNAAEFGYIQPGGSFYPDKAVTQQQALQLAVKILGADTVVQAQGGSLSHYIEMARTKKLLDGVKFKNGGMTRADAVNFVYNLLFAYPHDYEYIETGDTVKYRESSSTVLEAVHEVYVIEGVVTANEITNLNFNKKTRENYILIGDTPYVFAKGLVADPELLGQKVRAYYRDDNEIICIHSDEEQEIVKLNPDDISYSSGRYKCTENGKSKYYNLYSKCDIVYNDQAVGTLADSEYVPTEGNVTLIDRDGDGKYEVVKILNYVNNKVSNVSIADEFITFKFGSERYMDLSDIDYNVYKNGKKIQLSSIKSGDIIAVAESKDGSYCKFYIGTGKFEGTVKEMSETEVLLTEDRSLRISNGFLNLGEIGLGEAGTVYTDYFGNAVYYEYDGEKNLRYAYVYDIGFDENILNKIIQIKLHNTTGTGIYTITEDTKLSGTKYPNFDALETAIRSELYDDNGKFVPQMIRYVSDYDLNMKEMWTSEGSAIYMGNPDKTIKLLGGNPTTIAGGWYISDILAGSYLTDSDTVIFDIYYDGEDYECTIRPVSYFTTLSTRNVDYSAVYGTDSYEPADVILKYSSEGSGSRKYMMLDKINPAVDDNGTVQYMIYGCSENKKVSYMTSKATAISGLELSRGMVICCMISNDKVNNVSVVYDPDTGIKNGFSLITSTDSIYNDNDNSILQADVERINNGLVGLKNSSGRYMFWDKAIGGICTYDEEKDEVRVIASGGLRSAEEMPQDYSKVIAHVKSGNIRNMFVYR